MSRSIEIRRIDIILAGDADEGEESIAARIGKGRPIRWGVALSATLQTGQSEAIHSPEEWAKRVVKFTVSVALSIAVVWMTAMACCPRVLRTISSPLDSGA